MSKFTINKDDLFRVTFPDGEWADIKKEFSQRDLDYITNQLMKTKDEMQYGMMAMLERGIVAWSFADDSKPLAVDSENISNLKSKYREIILKEINRLSQEAKSFLSPAKKESASTSTNSLV